MLLSHNDNMGVGPGFGPGAMYIEKPSPHPGIFHIRAGLKLR